MGRSQRRSGKTVTMRYLATVEYSGKTYFVLSSTENEDTFEFADEMQPAPCSRRTDARWCA